MRVYLNTVRDIIPTLQTHTNMSKYITILFLVVDHLFSVNEHETVVNKVLGSVFQAAQHKEEICFKFFMKNTKEDTLRDKNNVLMF